MGAILRDLHFGARILAKRPGVTVLAVLSLALGIGASTAMFDVADGTLLNPLPLEDIDRLVGIKEAEGPLYVTYPLYRDFEEHSRKALELAAYAYPRKMSLAGDGRPRLARTMTVTADYFDVLGIRPAVGRLFRPEEERPETTPTAILTHRFWTRQFGADPDVIGRTINVNRRPVRIVGVARPAFHGTDLDWPTDLWVCLGGFDDLATGTPKLDLERENIHWLIPVGRLQPGVDIDQAEERFQAAQEELRPIHGYQVPHEKVFLDPLRVTAAGFEDRNDLVLAVGLLLVGSLTVLLIGCANVAHLLLARARERRKELAIRTAIGADRGDLLRQLMTESLLLGALGCAGGLVLSIWFRSLLIAFELPGDVELRTLDLGTDLRVFGFAAGSAVAAAILAGIAPALRSSRIDLRQALVIHSKTPSERYGGFSMLNVLVTLQFAFCMSVVASGGIFYRSLENVLGVDLGFDADEVIAAKVNLGLERYSEARAMAFYRRALREIDALPGVASSARSDSAPMTRSLEQTVTFEDERGPRERLRLNYSFVTPTYFETLGIPILRGRGFQGMSSSAFRNSVIVNRTMADRYWPDRDPLGETVQFGVQGPWLQIAGIAGDSKYERVTEAARPHFFVPAVRGTEYLASSETVFLVRTTSDSEELERLVEATIRKLDPRLPVYDVTLLTSEVAEDLSTPRMAVRLLGLYALVATSLAAMGAYGSVSYTTSRRTHEIGVRRALGAHRHEVVLLVIRNGVVAALVGIVLGSITAVVSVRVVESLLYGIAPTDPATYGIAAILLFALALLASLVPARRTATIDPMLVLKEQ